MTTVHAQPVKVFGRMPLSMIHLRPLLFGLLLALLSPPPAWSQADDLGSLRERAEAGNSKAQTQLGYHYHTGDGVERDFAEALKWYRLAAEQGNADAQYNLGVAYAFGEGVDKDLTQASNWYQRAAEQGHKVAAFSLGLSYLYGDGVQQDGGRAASWFRQSAEQGYTRAQVHLASIYHTGEGVPQDYEAAAYWYRQAAERGDATAQYNLGNLYRAGRGVPKDNDAARHWFNKAADQDYALAKAELESYQQRPAIPDAADPVSNNSQPEPTAAMPAMETDALSLTESGERQRVVSPPIETNEPASEADDTTVAPNDSVKKQTDPASRRDADAKPATPTSAESVEPSPAVNAEPAVTGFADMDPADNRTKQQADDADQSSAEPTTSKQRGGIAGFFGSLFGGDARDDNEADAADDASRSTSAATPTDASVPDNSEWREPVAEEPANQTAQVAGDTGENGQTPSESQSSAALALKDDAATGTSAIEISDAARSALASEDYAEAVRLLQQQALNGNAAAETQLGNLYFQGRGVEQSYDRALLWYRRAAKRHYADAQYNLGNMYLLGEGVLQSDSKARDWYAKAAAQGHEAAANNLTNIKRRMANRQRYNPDNHAGPTQREMQNALEEQAREEDTTEDSSREDNDRATAPADTTQATPPASSSRRIVSPPLAPANTDGQADDGPAAANGNGESRRSGAGERTVSPPLETAITD